MLLNGPLTPLMLSTFKAATTARIRINQNTTLEIRPSILGVRPVAEDNFALVFTFCRSFFTPAATNKAMIQPTSKMTIAAKIG